MKPEDNLRISIESLRVYGIEPNIINSMLSTLTEIVGERTKYDIVPFEDVPDNEYVDIQDLETFIEDAEIVIVNNIVL